MDINIRIEELIAVVNRFYPENPGEIGSYERDQITSQKLQEVIDGKPTTWTKVVKTTADTMKLPVNDIAYLQFPCYKLSIAMDEVKYPYITCNRSLILIVSLLCPYYTVYFEDDYRFSNVKREIRSRAAMFKILFSDIMPELFAAGNSYVATLKGIAEQYFPEYQYLNHKFLMRRKVRGQYELPWVSHNGPHSIFTYLFNNQSDFLAELME